MRWILSSRGTKSGLRAQVVTVSYVLSKCRKVSSTSCLRSLPFAASSIHLHTTCGVRDDSNKLLKVFISYLLPGFRDLLSRPFFGKFSARAEDGAGHCKKFSWIRKAAAVVPVRPGRRVVHIERRSTADRRGVVRAGTTEPQVRSASPYIFIARGLSGEVSPGPPQRLLTQSQVARKKGRSRSSSSPWAAGRSH